MRAAFERPVASSAQATIIRIMAEIGTEMMSGKLDCPSASVPLDISADIAKGIAPAAAATRSNIVKMFNSVFDRGLSDFVFKLTSNINVKTGYTTR